MVDRETDYQSWIVVGLVFLAVMLNYADRQVLALLKPMLQARFAWSDQDYGNMVSGFQFAAAVAFLGTGWFLDRVGLRLGFALGVAIWSLAGMAHALVGSVAGFVSVRTVLGAAESVGTPATVKAASEYFEPRERTLALGIGNAASNVGAILTPMLIPPLALAFGWQAAFLVTGGLGLVWVILWFSVKPHPRAVAAMRVPVAWKDIVRDRRTWTITIAKVLSDQVWFFMLFWLPDLLHRSFGLSEAQLGTPVAIIYVIAALGALSGGWLPNLLDRRGWSPGSARQMTLLVYALISVPIPVVLFVHSSWLAVGLLGLGLFANQGFSTNVFALAADIVPAGRVGSTIGIGAFCGNMVAIGMTQFAAWSLSQSWGYAPALAICSLNCLLACASVRLLMPRIDHVDDAWHPAIVPGPSE